MKAKYRKHADYRRRCRAKGLCPHCGEPCAPFAQCAERREYIRKRNNKGVYRVNPLDQRKWPRGPKPRCWSQHEDTMLRQLLKDGATTTAIAVQLARKVTAVEVRAKRLGIDMDAHMDAHLAILALRAAAEKVSRIETLPNSYAVLPRA